VDIMLYGSQSAEGAYVYTPNASTFEACNALKRDAEGVERLHLGILW